MCRKILDQIAVPGKNTADVTLKQPDQLWSPFTVDEINHLPKVVFALVIVSKVYCPDHSGERASGLFRRRSRFHHFVGAEKRHGKKSDNKEEYDKQQDKRR